MTMRIVALHHYPVKSFGGAALQSTLVEPRGLAGDRRWMMVTPAGRFLTRRELPTMAHVRASVAARGIVLSHRDGAQLAVSEPVGGAPVAVRVWADTVVARDAGNDAAQWLSDRFGRALRLVHMPDTTLRPVDCDYARDGDHVSFADGYPLLVTTVESLDALNRELAEPVAMAQFRPNLVIAGATAFAEDRWRILRIGQVTLRMAKACTRCVIITQDADTGDVVVPKEPLRTLKAMGRVMPGAKHQAIFGQDAIAQSFGTIAVGDTVDVVD